MAPTHAAPIVPGATSVAQPDNPRGILLMLAGFFLFSSGDIIAKVLTETMHPVQVVWGRQLGLALVIVVLIALRGTSILATRRPRLQILRGAVMVVSGTSFVVAVAHVPLADAVAVTFIAPFLVTVFGALLLGEFVGLRRWVAVSLGFAGTLIVIRPGMGVFHPAVFLLVLAAAAFAARQLLSRVLSSTETTTATVGYTALTASLLLTLPLPFFWTAPTLRDWGLMLALTVLAGAGEYLIIRALDVAQAVAVAPMQYSLMIWGTLWGYAVYADLPDFWTWTGAALIVGSGIYNLHREARVKTMAKSAELAIPGGLEPPTS